MLLEYTDALMKQARYDRKVDGYVHGEIPSCPGASAKGADHACCRFELQEVFERWLLLKLRDRGELPVVEGIELNEEVAVALGPVSPDELSPRLRPCAE